MGMEKCDVCSGNEAEYECRDITEHALLIHKIVTKANKNKRDYLSLSQLVEVWRGSSSSNLGKRLIADLNIKKMKTSQLTVAECEYVVGGLFVLKYLNIEHRFTAYQTVCVLVPGPNAIWLSPLNRKRNKQPITINMPLLRKRKRKKNNIKKRAKSEINSNSTPLNSRDITNNL